jgi:hypothetical protein
VISVTRTTASTTAIKMRASVVIDCMLKSRRMNKAQIIDVVMKLVQMERRAQEAVKPAQARV